MSKLQATNLPALNPQTPDLQSEGNQHSPILTPNSEKTQPGKHRSTQNSDPYTTPTNIKITSSPTSKHQPQTQDMRSSLPTPLLALGDALQHSTRFIKHALIATSVQTALFFPARKAINHQIKCGGSPAQSIEALVNRGGVGKLYQGALPAATQTLTNILCDTIALTGAASIFSDLRNNSDAKLDQFPAILQAAASASLCGAARVPLIPLENLGRCYQKGGKKSLQLIGKQVLRHGPSLLWHNTPTLVGTAMAEHFLRYSVRQILDNHLPIPQDKQEQLIRDIAIGLVSGMSANIAAHPIDIITRLGKSQKRPLSIPTMVNQLTQNKQTQALLTKGFGSKIVIGGASEATFNTVYSELRRTDPQYRARPTHAIEDNNFSDLDRYSFSAMQP